MNMLHGWTILYGKAQIGTALHRHEQTSRRGKLRLSCDLPLAQSNFLYVSIFDSSISLNNIMGRIFSPVLGHKSASS